MTLVIAKNTYVSLVEANEYFQTKMNSEAWDSASDELKEKALIESTRLLNSYRYAGTKVSSTQELAFPRVNIGRELTEGELIIYGSAPKVIPNDVKYAQLEQAIYLIEGPSEARRLAGEGVVAFSAGGASMTFTQGTASSAYIAMAPIAKHYLMPYLSRTGVLK